jgi:hypothetical protein
MNSIMGSDGLWNVFLQGVGRHLTRQAAHHIVMKYYPELLAGETINLISYISVRKS